MSTSFLRGVLAVHWDKSERLDNLKLIYKFYLTDPDPLKKLYVILEFRILELASRGRFKYVLGYVDDLDLVARSFASIKNALLSGAGGETQQEGK